MARPRRPRPTPCSTGRDTAPPPVPQDGADPPLRGAHRGAVHARPHRRLLPPRDRRGGRERRRDRRRSSGRLPARQLPRPRHRAGRRQRARLPSWPSCSARQTGVADGRGGSMHLLDVERRFFGGWGIVGGHLPIAVGAALALDYRDQPQRRALPVRRRRRPTPAPSTRRSTWPRIWNLPIVFQIINNQYGMGTSVEQASAEPELWQPRRRLPDARRAGRRQRRAGRARGRRPPAGDRAREERAAGPARDDHLPLPRPLALPTRARSTARPRRSTRGGERDPITRFGLLLQRARRARPQDEIDRDPDGRRRRGQRGDRRGRSGAASPIPTPSTSTSTATPHWREQFARMRAGAPFGERGEARARGRPDLPRGAAPRARRGARPRPRRVPDGRGDRPLRGLLQGHRRASGRSTAPSACARRRSRRRASSAPASAPP